ncbi:MAG: hypothetical protein LBQ98_06975 [Nitrososphaerota archaeon]|jgi:ribosome biogenesis protein Nip4|nr:hypothetical protein [Nitrososphaerota archaeon]
MKAKTVTNFATTLGVNLFLNPEVIIEKNGRFYLIDAALRPLMGRSDFFYAGLFLGKAKAGKFFPSFPFLSFLAKKNANRIVVDKKAAWLFICGRPLFAKSVVRVFGSGKKNTNVLVLNESGDCLGFGRITGDLTAHSEDGEIAVRCVSDVGDFLRRER